MSRLTGKRGNGAITNSQMMKYSAFILPYSEVCTPVIPKQSDTHKGLVCHDNQMHKVIQGFKRT